MLIPSRETEVLIGNERALGAGHPVRAAKEPWRREPLHNAFSVEDTVHVHPTLTRWKLVQHWAVLQISFGD